MGRKGVDSPGGSGRSDGLGVGVTEPKLDGHLMFRGIPDDGKVKVASAGMLATPRYLFPGTPSFRPHLDGLLDDLTEIWCGPPASAIALSVPVGPMINYLGDPDVYGIGLNKAARIVQSLGQPCFNAPDAVQRSRRDRVARALEGIDGLVVPQVLRLEPTSLEDLLGAIVAAGLSWPLLFRPTGVQGGEGLFKATGPGDPILKARPWLLSGPIYVTEFKVFRDPDGLWRKSRLAVVGGKPILRHVIIGGGWKLHTRKLHGTEDDEAQRLARFDGEVLPIVARTLEQIAERMRLDYFGIDAHIAGDGTITLFEANPCMNILQVTRPSPNIWDAPMGRIKSELVALLHSPERWYHQGQLAEPSRS